MSGRLRGRPVEIGRGVTDSTLVGPIDLAREDTLQVGPLTIVPSARTVHHADSRAVVLEPRQMQLLVALLRAEGSVLSRDDIIESCWDGRIVGDDSISSVIYRLRRDLKDLAEGVFTIDTVTKVGFRILRHDLPEGGEKSRAAPLPPQAARLRQLPNVVWAAAAVLAIGLVGGLTAWRSAPQGPPYSVSVEPFRADQGAAGFDDEVISELSIQDIPTAGGSVKLTVAGSVQHRGGTTRINSRLVDSSRGEVVWSTSGEVPSAQPAMLAAAAAQLGLIIQCTVAGANDAGERLASEILSLYARSCEMAVSNQGVRGLEITRELTERAPDFAAGWWTHVYLLAVMHAQQQDDDNAYAREGIAAADELIALRPERQEGYLYKALLMPAEPVIEREAMLRRALPLEAMVRDAAEPYLGDFLLQTGRAEEAYALYRNQVQRTPTALRNQGRLFLAASMTDRERVADAALARVTELDIGGGNADFGRWRRAVWSGDWAEAERSGRFADTRTADAAKAAYRALASGSAAGETAAAALVASASRPRASAQPSEALQTIELLALLGHNAEAFARLERFRDATAPGRRPGYSNAFLWDPAMRGLWRDPAFLPFLRRHGYIAYWRASKSRPDLCREPGPPPFCTALN